MGSCRSRDSNRRISLLSTCFTNSKRIVSFSCGGLIKNWVFVEEPNYFCLVGKQQMFGVRNWWRSCFLNLYYSWKIDEVEISVNFKQIHLNNDPI